MKRAICILALVLALLCSACAASDEAEDAGDTAAEVQSGQTADAAADEAAAENEEATSENDEEVISMTMKINDEVVNVKWENNESVKALMKMAAEEPVVVNMSMYGGFEQVGSLGTTLPSNDQNTKTKPGDIVLYTSDSIVVFYGNNSWAYTRLGHIEDKSKAELQDLLSRGNVVITITAE